MERLSQSMTKRCLFFNMTPSKYDKNKYMLTENQIITYYERDRIFGATKFPYIGSTSLNTKLDHRPIIPK